MRRLLLLATLFVAFTIDAATGYDGLCGRDLMMHIRLTDRPIRYASSASELWQTIALTDAVDSGDIVDRFNGGVKPRSTMTLINIADARWWGLTPFMCEQSFDLHNVIPTTTDIRDLKRDYPPGEVTDPIYDNGCWAVGTKLIGDIPINTYTPPKGYEGDFARSILYAIAVYPCDRWIGQAMNIATDNDFPVLQRWFKLQLLTWNAIDPPSDYERQRNSLIHTAQGNLNPFIEHPELAEYIWGDKANEPYVEPSVEPVTPDDPVEPQTPTPLKGVYLTSESTIYLTSPYIPDNAVWTVDGHSVSGQTIAITSLSVGKHELHFHSGDIRGRLTIEIKEP